MLNKKQIGPIGLIELRNQMLTSPLIIIMSNLIPIKMKKLSKIKLNQFSKDELERRKMNALKGGCGCTAGCGCTGDVDACRRTQDDVASRYESY